MTTAAIFAVTSRADRFPVIDGALWTCALGVAWWRSARRPRSSRASVPAVRDTPTRWSWALWAALVLCAVALVRSSAGLHGAWDAWAIWNQRARVFVRARDWTQAFDMSSSHPDYPLLLPLTVARLWAWHGVETPWIPFFLGTVFGAAALLVVIGTTAVLNPPARITAGLLLIGSPWIWEVPAELADVPVSVFFTTSFGLAAVGWRKQMPAMLMLAGMAASMAAWTKNEGLLFALVAPLAWRLKGKPLLLWIAGALPGFFTVGWFNLTLAPPSDLVQPAAVIVGKLLDPRRHAAVVHVLPGAAGWWWAPPAVVLVCLLIATWRDETTRAGMALVVLMLASYYLVYVTTPHPQAWHVETSFPRLLAQVWPTAVLAVTAASREHYRSAMRRLPSPGCESPKELSFSHRA
jgi:hypothetical protein